MEKSSLQVTDDQSKAVQKTLNRVSLADIESNIAAEYTFTADKAVGNSPILDSLKILTVCIIVMKNGFTIIGKTAPADAENFDADLGRKFAREDAIRQIWPLMGFALREEMARAA